MGPEGVVVHFREYISVTFLAVLIVGGDVLKLEALIVLAEGLIEFCREDGSQYAHG